MKETSRKKLKEDCYKSRLSRWWLWGAANYHMWGCMDTCSQSVSSFLSFYQSTNLQRPLLSAPPKKKKNNQKKKWNKLVLCYCRVQFCDIDLTLLPSLGEVGECQELLNSVWQWVKHESMNSPQSLLPSAAFNSWTSLFLYPAARPGKKTIRVTENRMATTNSRPKPEEIDKLD